MKEFNPSDIFDQLRESGLDPSIFNTIDETQFPKAPNFLEWAVGPQYLNTLILPKQVEIGTKLFCEYCPDCSNPGYIDQLFDQTIGNIKNNVVFLEHGVCPKCKTTRWEFTEAGKMIFRNELVGACGQRCQDGRALVFTDRGIIKLSEVVEGDLLSHGRVSKVFDSGVLPELRIRTKYNYTLSGARDSHIIAYLTKDSEIAFKHMKEFQVRDIAILYSPPHWPRPLPDTPNTIVSNAVAGIQDGTLNTLPPELMAGGYDNWGWLISELFEAEDSFRFENKVITKQIRVIMMNLGIISDCQIDDGKYVVTIQEYEPPKGYACDQLIEDGYYPVEVLEIEEGESIPMVDVQIPGSNAYTADCGFVHNSGKSKLVAMLATYINHRFLKIPNPLRTFNQSSGDMFLGTFSGLTLDQCNRNLWSPFRSFMDASPWFQNYHRYLRDQEKKLGVELFHELQNSLTYIHKNMHWYSTGSEARKMRGDTRIFAAIDELGWMISDEAKADLLLMNADAVYTSLVNSLTTMRTKYRQVNGPDNYDLPPILMANVSSPSSAKDKIMRLVKDAKKNTRILAFNVPTWEMNPDFTYTSLREEFSHYDELTFNRDFGAEPPLAANPFLSESRLVDKIAVTEGFSGFRVTTIVEKDNFGDNYKTARMTILKPDKIIPRLVTFDLGYRKNSLAACVFSLSPESKPRLDFAIAITPDPNLKIRANVVDVFEKFTVPLVENYRIKHAFFDRWQSLDQIERLKMMEVDARMYSLTYKDMESVRGSIIAQSVEIPKLDKPMADYVREYVEDSLSTDNASAVLGMQLLTVRDMGHKMTKPLLGDDDIFRAFCLGVVKLSDPMIKKDYMDVVQIDTGHRVSCLGTLRFRSDESSMGGGMGSMEGSDGRILGTVRTRKT